MWIHVDLMWNGAVYHWKTASPGSPSCFQPHVILSANPLFSDRPGCLAKVQMRTNACKCTTSVELEIASPNQFKYISMSFFCQRSVDLDKSDDKMISSRFCMISSSCFLSCRISVFRCLSHFFFWIQAERSFLPNLSKALAKHLNEPSLCLLGTELRKVFLLFPAWIIPFFPSSRDKAFLAKLPIQPLKHLDFCWFHFHGSHRQNGQATCAQL